MFLLRVILLLLLSGSEPADAVKLVPWQSTRTAHLRVANHSSSALSNRAGSTIDRWLRRDDLDGVVSRSVVRGQHALRYPAKLESVLVRGLGVLGFELFEIHDVVPAVGTEESRRQAQTRLQTELDARFSPWARSFLHELFGEPRLVDQAILSPADWSSWSGLTADSGRAPMQGNEVFFESWRIAVGAWRFHLMPMGLQAEALTPYGPWLTVQAQAFERWWSVEFFETAESLTWDALQASIRNGRAYHMALARISTERLAALELGPHALSIADEIARARRATYFGTNPALMREAQLDRLARAARLLATAQSDPKQIALAIGVWKKAVQLVRLTFTQQDVFLSVRRALLAEDFFPFFQRTISFLGQDWNTEANGEALRVTQDWLKALELQLQSDPIAAFGITLLRVELARIAGPADSIERTLLATRPARWEQLEHLQRYLSSPAAGQNYAVYVNEREFALVPHSVHAISGGDPIECNAFFNWIGRKLVELRCMNEPIEWADVLPRQALTSSVCTLDSVMAMLRGPRR